MYSANNIKHRIGLDTSTKLELSEKSSRSTAKHREAREMEMSRVSE